MVNSGLFFGWDAPARGREAMAIELFQSWMGYFTKQQKAGVIHSFEPVMMSRHGGDMNGFILVRGERDKLHEMMGEDEYFDLINTSSYLVDGFGVIPCYLGDDIGRVLTSYGKNIK
jgi:hypothetical protein